VPEAFITGDMEGGTSFHHQHKLHCHRCITMLACRMHFGLGVLCHVVHQEPFACKADEESAVVHAGEAAAALQCRHISVWVHVLVRVIALDCKKILLMPPQAEKNILSKKN
jgi:hypothetical protein